MGPSLAFSFAPFKFLLLLKEVQMGQKKIELVFGFQCGAKPNLNLFFARSKPLSKLKETWIELKK
jgi:hypothetical protein